MNPDVCEVIDVDAFEPDPDIPEFQGYRRNLVKTKEHKELQEMLTKATKKGPIVIDLLSDEDPGDQAAPSSFCLQTTRLTSQDKQAPETQPSSSQAPVTESNPRSQAPLFVQLHTPTSLKRTVPIGSRVEPPAKRPKQHKRSSPLRSSNHLKRPREFISGLRNSNNIAALTVEDSSDEEEPTPKKTNRSQSSGMTCAAAVKQRTPAWPSSGEEEIRDVERALGLSAINMPLSPELEPCDESIDSDAEYATVHGALDLAMSANWEPLPKSAASSVSKQDAGLLSKMAALSVSASASNSRRHRRKQTGGQVCQGELSSLLLESDTDEVGYNGKPFIWTKCQSAFGLARIPRSIRHGLHDQFRVYRGLQPVISVSRASGSVNKIVQSNGVIAVASCPVDGLYSDDGLPLSPYNREGSLIIWHNNKDYVVHGHERRYGETGQDRLKYYTVNDVQFDPTVPTRLVSSGHDRMVRIWDCGGLERGARPRLRQTVSYDDCVPDMLLFKPGDSLLAILGSDGYVYLQQVKLSHTQKTGLPLAPNMDHSAEAMAWGRASKSHVLFASSAARDNEDGTGFHKAFDTIKCKLICEFDVKEKGSEMAVDEVGASLMVATEGPEGSHTLWQYDARRLARRVVQKISLEPFNGSGQVNRLTYSPDGIYLAVARHDNTIHIYDSRYLKRRVLHALAHDKGTIASEKTTTYGVVEARWVEGSSRGLGLVTGGVDGCVRLWDMNKAPDDPLNGAVLARCDDDIGHFSLGDCYEGEKPLVVGECASGKVTIFDRIGRMTL
ncbi:hypothetical protein AcW1_000514 [Taiwanofungus camphoratus]|nr:hypothetical protein AcW1_000514 [Antrodia cinnamomea]